MHILEGNSNSKSRTILRYIKDNTQEDRENQNHVEPF